MPTRSWQREIAHQDARTAQLEADLALAREMLATIRRICAAAGSCTTNVNPVECVKVLAREHCARGAMNAVLHRQQEERRTVTSDGPRRAERSIEQQHARTASRAQEEAAAFGVLAPAPVRKPLNLHQVQRDIARLIPAARISNAAPLEQGRRRY